MRGSVLPSWSTVRDPVWVIIGVSILIRMLAISTNDLLVEEAYYWNYAVHLDFGYLDHPPMVALLIRGFTALFGINEFAVRIGAMVCWCLTAFFMFRLSELIAPKTGKYAVMCLAILPFFFLQSLVITPDQPLVACWAAGLYCLYRALVCRERQYWYLSGICLGLGMLSKYTMVLLVPTVLVYVVMLPSARDWFLRKEPYFAALLALGMFSPVIYWNATHDWASFVFQGSRRLTLHAFTLHYVVGWLVLFLLPLGIVALVSLMRKEQPPSRQLVKPTKRFIQIFTAFPLLFFALYSLQHPIKFNWIGPGLLALIPWLALLMHTASHTPRWNWYRVWLLAAAILLMAYASMVCMIILGIPEGVNDQLFRKYIDWSHLVTQFNRVANAEEAKTRTAPIMVPLDLYNISSELAFYQAKLFKQGKIPTQYAVSGRHVFGADSLMYRYWSHPSDLQGKTLLLISTELAQFNDPSITHQVAQKSAVYRILSQSQGRGGARKPYFYQWVELQKTT